MTALLVAAGTGVAIVVIALVLPCEACRKRRERLRAATAALKQRGKSR